MKQTKIASKGYTIEVVSWENDGDFYQTQRMTVETESEARKIQKICKELFEPEEGGIGNSMDGEGEGLILDYIQKNPEMELTLEYINKLSRKLLGDSEYYDYRVCESVEITYLEEDVYAQVIE